jgi:pimeloyl-ACP methyl ester carboxylesterase
MTRSLLWILVLTSAACQRDDTVAVVHPPPLIEVTTTTTDGVPLAYDMRGSGDTDLVFIHCWSCDRTFWREQLDFFAESYRVVSIDLPGHGASGSERESWHIADLAADVKTVVDELGLERVVLIGHSMGGPVSLFAAQLMPERVIGIACIDTLHNAEMEYPKEQFEQILAGYESDFAGTMARMVQGAFPEGADPELIDWVLGKSQAAEPEVAIALLRDFPRLDLRAAFSAVKVPIRCINAQRGYPTEVEINRKYADFDAVLMEGVGHFLHLEKPDETNAHLARILADLTTESTQSGRTGK